MTVIDVTAAVTAIGGSAAVQDGSVLIEYLYGEDGIPSTRTDGSTALLPHAIRVPVVDGAPVYPVDVPPTDGRCYARVTVAAVKPYAPTPLVLPAVAIPAAGPVEISALVAVDRSSYEPSANTVTAWQVAIAEVADIRMEVVLEAGRAVGAAMDAGSYAEATEFDANRAGASAFQAGQSAASALGHKNDAKGSADAAAGSATSAASAVVAANLERQGAADERLGARQERQDAQTARTGAETAQSSAVTARTGAETARTGSETAKTGAETARTGAEQARDLALAGQFLGSALTSATDLNAVTTPGVYRCPSGAFATSANNYPAVGVAGVLTVTQWGGSGQVIQRYTPYPSIGTPNIIIGEWIRAYRGSSFSGWRFMATQRVDQTAGRAIYTVDDVNGREQLLWGDTGWRNVTADLINGYAVTSMFAVRRIGNRLLYFVEGLTRSASSASQVAYQSVAGLRPTVPTGSARDTLHTATSPVSAYRVRQDGNTSDFIVDLPVSSPAVYGIVELHTDQAWPTVLPGVAVGGVPNA